jgi:aerobic carbon-monoxide dehydrogenase large subunit
MTEQCTPYVGRSLRRREDRKFLTGRGRYVDDIALPGMLYLAILRSPHAHARITGTDLSAARAAADVRLAVAGASLAQISLQRAPPPTCVWLWPAAT